MNTETISHPSSARLLVGGDDLGFLAELAARLRAGGSRVDEPVGLAALPRALASRRYDLVLLDLDLGGPEGFELLGEVAALPEAPGVLVLAEAADVESAVRAMRLGAENLLVKPVDPDALGDAIDSALRNRLPSDRSDASALDALPPAVRPIGRAPGLRRVLDQIERVATAARTTTLILGESGTGKEMVAGAIHALSDRAAAPFVALNCAALTDGLLEAELFGYEPGSFTGAAPKGHAGLFAAAEGGTLFLDEIGELALPLQAKLLRVLQEGTYRRVGGTRDESADVRIVSSTNRDLERCVAEGGFREDLYYRLNVMTIRVPPLCERVEDIPVLANGFLEEFRLELGRELEGFSESAMQRLISHRWPGNVRELRNTVERGALLAESGRIQPRHLGLPLRCSPGTEVAEEDLSLQAVERAHISRVIRATAGNRSRAARLLGVNRTTLYNKLRRYGIAATK